jgi:hypothetical protein
MAMAASAVVSPLQRIGQDWTGQTTFEFNFQPLFIYFILDNLTYPPKRESHSPHICRERSLGRRLSLHPHASDVLVGTRGSGRYNRVNALLWGSLRKRTGQNKRHGSASQPLPGRTSVASHLSKSFVYWHAPVPEPGDGPAKSSRV